MSVRTLPFAGLAPSGAFRAMVIESWTRLGVMLRARRTRQLLGEMDDRMLADIGVGRGEALVEAGRPMWDIEAGRS